MPHITIQDPKKNPHDLVVGIDLGTTNSLLTYWDGETFQFMEWQSDKILLPSIATYDHQGTCRIGFDALDKPLDSGLLASTKRLMDDPNQHIWGKITPLKVATDILTYMKKQTEEKLNRKITACIITVPAYFDEAQRLATKTAANLAGLNVLRLINEPTAAALAYGLDQTPQGTFAVYDLGGGTFDVSILDIQDHFFHVLATHGDTLLGGDDIDQAIIQHWYGQGHRDMTLMRKCVRPIKESVSTCHPGTEEQGSKVSGTQENSMGPGSADFVLVRDDSTLDLSKTELKHIIAPILATTFHHFDQGLKDAEITSLDGIILVGGATKTCGLKEAVQETYPFPIYDDLNPETIVALGAGMHAHSLIFGGKHVLLDVTPLSLGVEMAGGIVDKIIHRNTPLPVRQEQLFTTYENNQTGIKFNIVQGEREFAKDCRSLAKFSIKNIPPMPAGRARAYVTFQIDVDGLITVSAVEQISGQTLSIQIESDLSPQERDAMIADAMKHAAQDMKARSTVIPGVTKALDFVRPGISSSTTD